MKTITFDDKQVELLLYALDKQIEDTVFPEEYQELRNLIWNTEDE
jgi:hypothetical protein